MKKIFFGHGCCDNVIFMGKRGKCRCNDGIKSLPMWKKLAQISLGVHRENDASNGKIPHFGGWRVKILKRIIKSEMGDAPWRWIKTK